MRNARILETLERTLIKSSVGFSYLKLKIDKIDVLIKYVCLVFFCL